MAGMFRQGSACRLRCRWCASCLVPPGLARPPGGFRWRACIVGSAWRRRPSDRILKSMAREIRSFPRQVGAHHFLTSSAHTL